MMEFEHAIAIKVCGLTNVPDALSCAAAGADMIGLNFSSLSLRCIDRRRAAQITAAVRPRFPETKFVGVFVNQESDLVRRLATDLALDAVQLHGDETPDYVRKLDLLFVIKALRVGRDFSEASSIEYGCEAILLDTWSSTLPGGTGETFPWSAAESIRARVKRLILAGGLTSENVGEAIRTVRPFAVDVCSGVEGAPGQKDPARVELFVENVRAAEEAKSAR